MRAFFATFLLGWVIGVAAGVFEWSSVLIVASVLLLAVFAWWHRSSRPLIVAISALVLLGWVYGAVTAVSPAGVCSDATQPSHKATAGKGIVRITAVQKVTEQTVRYITATRDGCRVLLTAARFPRYNEGDELKLAGSLEPVESLVATNPDYAHYLAEQGIRLTIRFPDVTVISTRPTLLARARQRVRRQVERVFAEPEASLVLAVITGERGTLPEELEENFQLTGVTHLLSISGFHMSLMVGMLFLLLLLLPLSPWWRTFLALVLMWVYLAFIGWPPAATRAVLFWSATLIALRLGLLVSLPTVVLFALVAMATYNPSLLRDVGFQLSVLAVTGISLVMFLSRPSFAKASAGKWPWFRWVVLSLLVTLGATLTTWPIVLYRFGNVSFISPVANLLVQPVFPALMVISLVTLLVSLVSGPLALLGSWAVGLLYDWMDVITRWLAAVPGAAMTQATISPLIIYIYYAALLLSSALLLRMQRRRWREMWSG